MSYVYTNHASFRCEDRNIPNTVVDVIFEKHDRETPCGKGLFSLWISKNKIRKLLKKGEITNDIYEQLGKLVVLVDPETSTIISVIKTYGKRGRHYYNDCRRRKRHKRKTFRYP